MKPLLLTILLAGSVIACNKEKTTVIEDPAPVASFTVKNTVEAGTVMQGTPLEIENTSTNAVAYSWDFDDGTVSTERNPTGIVFRQCIRSQCVRLTVRNRNGVSSTVSYCIRVRCR